MIRLDARQCSEGAGALTNELLVSYAIGRYSNQCRPIYSCLNKQLSADIR